MGRSAASISLMMDRMEVSRPPGVSSSMTSAAILSFSACLMADTIYSAALGEMTLSTRMTLT